MEEYETVERMANESLDIVIPKLAEEYDLELHKPSISISIYEYMHDMGRFIPTGTYGLIKLQEEACTPKLECCGTASHEMGHAAIYQNCPNYQENYNSNVDFELDFLEEGISQKFMKKGLKFLKDEKYLSKYDFYSNVIVSSTFRKVLKEFLFPNVYIIGEMIIDHYDKKGVSIKRLIISPEEFKEDLKNNWKKMVKPQSRPAIKLYEKVWNYLNSI
ncbi:MAG: hypothetical protein Q8O03_02560 [Nanoarchaeota archaeon]|nr:hypothetical protein [Nanoarchaeota archaeon]